MSHSRHLLPLVASSCTRKTVRQTKKRKALSTGYPALCMKNLGKTKSLSARIRQPKNDVRHFFQKRVQCCGSASNSTIALTPVVPSSWSEKKNYQRQLLFESWHIQKTTKNINRSSGTLRRVYLQALCKVLTRLSLPGTNYAKPLRAPLHLCQSQHWRSSKSLRC